MGPCKDHEEIEVAEGLKPDFERLQSLGMTPREASNFLDNWDMYVRVFGDLMYEVLGYIPGGSIKYTQEVTRGTLIWELRRGEP